MVLSNTTEGMLVNLSVTDEVEHRNLWQIATSGLFLLLIILLATIGNILVAIAVCCFAKLRDDPANMLILNLAVTDLSSAVVVMLMSFISLVADEWPFGSFFCNMICAANYCFIIVSMLTLCFISIERYQAVLHPLHYHQRITRRRLLYMIAYTWLQGVLFAITPVIYSWIHYDYWEVVCAIDWHSDQRAFYYVISAFVMCFLIPGIVLGICYFQMLMVARRCRISCHKTNRQHNTGNTQRQSSHTSKTIRSLIFIVLAYFICLSPFCVTKLIKVIYQHPNFVPAYMNLLASWFAYLASGVNPLIYGIFRKDFRAVFLKILKKIPLLAGFGAQNETVVSSLQMDLVSEYGVSSRA